MSKLVSIVIPCYNHEKYLDSCLQSIIDQSYENIELLICDDCSLDGSFQKLLAWKPLLKKRFSRVEIYKNDVNQGVCRTLNGLIRKSKGAYIKDLASDDMLQKNAISDYVQFAEEHAFDIVFSNAFSINEKDQYPLDEQIMRSPYYSSVPPHGFYLTKKLAAGDFVQGATLFFKRETFEKYGLFDEQYLFEDWEFLLRVSVSGSIEYMDKMPVYYRVMDGTLSHYSRDENGREKHRKFYEDRKKIYTKYSKGLSRKEKSKFYNQSLRVAIVLNDYELCNEIIREVKSLKLSVFWGNRIRWMTLEFGVYNILRMLKNFAKRIQKK